MPGEQVLVGADEEAPRAAGGVHEAHGGHLVGGAVVKFCPYGTLHDVAHDVGRGIVDPAGLLHLGLLLHADAVAIWGFPPQPDGLAEEALVDAP